MVQCALQNQYLELLLLHAIACCAKECKIYSYFIDLASLNTKKAGFLIFFTYELQGGPYLLAL